MIVASEMTLKELMSQIVGATHGLMDEIGERQTVSTIPEERLRMAAICALQIATGEPVWPGDRTIVIRRQERRYGIFREEV